MPNLNKNRKDFVMKESLYIYNSGTLMRKDNTLRFMSENGVKKDIPIEKYSDIYAFGEINYLL